MKRIKKVMAWLLSVLMVIGIFATNPIQVAAAGENLEVKAYDATNGVVQYKPLGSTEWTNVQAEGIPHDNMVSASAVRILPNEGYTGSAGLYDIDGGFIPVTGINLLSEDGATLDGQHYELSAATFSLIPTTAKLRVQFDDGQNANGKVQYKSTLEGQWQDVTENTPDGTYIDAVEVKVVPNEGYEVGNQDFCGLFDGNHSKVNGNLLEGVQLTIGEDYSLEHLIFEIPGGGNQGGGNTTSFSLNTMEASSGECISQFEISINESTFDTYDFSPLSLNEGDRIKIRVCFVNDGNSYEVINPSIVYIHKTNDNTRFNYIYDDGTTQAPSSMASDLSSEDGFAFVFKPQKDSTDAGGQIGLNASDAWMRLQFDVKRVFNDKAEVFIFSQTLGNDGVSYGANNEVERDVFEFVDNVEIGEIGVLINNNQYGEMGDPINLGYGYKNDGTASVNGGNPITVRYQPEFEGHTQLQEVEALGFVYFGEVGVTNPTGNAKNTFRLKEEFARSGLIDSIYVAVGNSGDFQNAIEIPRGENGDFYFELEPSTQYSFLIRRHDSGERNIGWHYVSNGEGDDCYVDYGKVYVQKIVRGNTTILDGLQKNESGEVVLDEYGTPSYSVDLLNTDGVEGDWSITTSGGNINVKRGDVVTIKLVPTYGYQLASASLNGSVLTPNEEVSSFTFTVGGNLHLGGSFAESKDVTTNNSEVVSNALIEGGENATDTGNLELTVEDNEGYEKESEVMDMALDGEAGLAVIEATLDLTLDNLVSKGDGNFWTTNLTEFDDDILVSLQLDDMDLGEEGRVVVIRDHEGTLDMLDASYDNESGMVTFPTNKFSTYSFIKVDEQQNGPKTMIDVLNDIEDTPEAIAEAFDSSEKMTELAESIVSDSDIEEVVKVKESAYAEANNITIVSPVVSEAATKLGADMTKIQVVGAGLNAKAGETVKLSIDVPEKPVEVESNFEDSVQLEIKLYINGESKNGKLMIPISITVPVPEGINPEKLAIIHVHGDGTKEEIETLRFNDDKTVTFCVTSFSTFVFSNDKDKQLKEFVKRMYAVCLDRRPDEKGLADWVEILTGKKMSVVEVAAGFVFSTEFINKNYCDSCYVDYMYKAFFDRDAKDDPNGKKTWTDALLNGETREFVFNGFATSDEFKALCKEYGIEPGEAIAVPARGTIAIGNCAACGDDSGAKKGVSGFVSRLYKVCLDRDPDRKGIEDWTDRLVNKEMTASEVARGFVLSDEFIDRKMSDEEFVEYMYKAFFDRASDPQGRETWLGGLTDGSMGREDVMNGFIGSEEFGALCNSFGIDK